MFPHEWDKQSENILPPVMMVTGTERLKQTKLIKRNIPEDMKKIKNLADLCMVLSFMKAL